MDFNSMTRMILRGAVRKTIRGLKNDPERTLRNLVDLALSHADGPHGKALLSHVQSLLRQKDSAYYVLVRRLADHVDPENLEAFLFNIGYNSCADGVKTLREQEEKLGFALPWLIGLESGRMPDFPGSAQRVMEQGKRLGIYLYLFAGEEALSPACADLYRRHDDCALLILSPAEKLTDQSVGRLRQVRHAMLSVSSRDRIELNRACGLLRQQKLLYAIHVPYGTEAEARAMISPANLAFYASLEPACLFLAGPGDGGAPLPAVRDLTLGLRLGQKYPFLIADLPSDVGEIDRMISERPCSLAFRDKNRLATPRGAMAGEAYDLIRRPLVEILRSAGQ